MTRTRHRLSPQADLLNIRTIDTIPRVRSESDFLIIEIDHTGAWAHFGKWVDFATESHPSRFVRPSGLLDS